MKTKDKVSNKAWVGEWNDGMIGWLLPFSADGTDDTPDFQQRKEIGSIPETLFRCRITVERLRDSRGRYITRKVSEK
jgi:hypothetical protein